MQPSHLSPQAESDLDDIWLYIARRSGSMEVATSFIERIGKTILQLVDSPRMGRRRDDLEPGCRSFPVGEYLVFYSVSEDDEVVVLRVFHGRRDPEVTRHAPKPGELR